MMKRKITAGEFLEILKAIEFNHSVLFQEEDQRPKGMFKGQKMTKPIYCCCFSFMYYKEFHLAWRVVYP